MTKPSIYEIPRALGRAFLVQPLVPGIFVVLLLLPFASYFVEAVNAQPWLGYFLGTTGLRQLSMDVYPVAIILLIALPISYFSYKIRPKEFKPAKKPTLWLSVSFLIACAAALGPRTYRHAEKVIAEAVPVEDADRVVLETIDLLVRNQFDELKKQLPPENGGEAIEKKFPELVGDDAKVKYLKVAHVGDLQAGRYGLDQTVIYWTELSGSNGTSPVFVHLYREGATWRPAAVMMFDGRERAYRQAVQTAGMNYLTKLLDGDYRGGWSSLTARVREGQTFEAYEKSLRDFLAPIQKNESLSIVEVRPLDAPALQAELVQLILRARTHEHAYRIELTVRREGNEWKPESLVTPRMIY